MEEICENSKIFWDSRTQYSVLNFRFLNIYRKNMFDNIFRLNLLLSYNIL